MKENLKLPSICAFLHVRFISSDEIERNISLWSRLTELYVAAEYVTLLFVFRMP
jgi:hypothetical protein